MKGQRALRLDIYVGPEDIHARVLRAGTQKACVIGGAQPRHSSGQDDMSACGFDGNIPASADHVPIEFVVILKEAQAVSYAIVKGNISRSILRGGDKYL